MSAYIYAASIGAPIGAVCWLLLVLARRIQRDRSPIRRVSMRASHTGFELDVEFKDDKESQAGKDP
jgi:hypothetical protein